MRLHPEKDLGIEGDASPEPVRTLMCEVCDKIFFTEDGLQQHMMRQHREDPIKYACLTCGKTFKNNHLFGQHMSKSHKNIICEGCPTNAGKRFGSKSALKMQTLNKHPKDTRMLILFLCFLNNNDLERAPVTLQIPVIISITHKIYSTTVWWKVRVG